MLNGLEYTVAVAGVLTVEGTPAVKKSVFETSGDGYVSATIVPMKNGVTSVAGRVKRPEPCSHST